MHEGTTSVRGRNVSQRDYSFVGLNCCDGSRTRMTSSRPFLRCGPPFPPSPALRALRHVSPITRLQLKYRRHEFSITPVVRSRTAVPGLHVTLPLIGIGADLTRRLIRVNCSGSSAPGFGGLCRSHRSDYQCPMNARRLADGWTEGLPLAPVSPEGRHPRRHSVRNIKKWRIDE